MQHKHIKQITTGPMISPVKACPGCGGTFLGSSLELPNQLVMLNYRHRSAEEAARAARRDMSLRECLECGLIYNEILDASALSYDECYDNRQGFSPAFREMLDDTASRLAERHLRPGTSVLEVGCGKGDFLKLICHRYGCQGLGYDTSCGEEGLGTDGLTQFFRRYATDEDVSDDISIIICRHVVEHVQEIGEFFRLLARMASKGGSPAVYVETPAFEWIAENQAFWDVFYEHCNYFTMNCLRVLAEQAGLTVLDHRLIFGGQYQALELAYQGVDARVASAAASRGQNLPVFVGQFLESRHRLKARLQENSAEPGNWALWGAGAKGVALCNTLQDFPPGFVVDSNPAKQGLHVPGTRIPIVSPTDPRLAEAALILVANPNYLQEISRQFTEHGVTSRLLPL